MGLKPSLDRTVKIAVAASALVLVAGSAAALLFSSHRFLLASSSDIISFALTAAIFIGLVRCALATHRHVRAFWFLLAAGAMFRCLNLGLWVYYETFLRQPVPEILWWSLIGFLQVMPFLVGLALLPHTPNDRKTIHLVSIDLFIVSIWWLFVYLFTIAPWQYVHPDFAQYYANFRLAYQAELACLSLVLFFFWKNANTESPWKRIYAHLFFAQVAYSLASLVITFAIGLPANSRLHYRSGDLYDVPFVISLIYWVWLSHSLPSWILQSKTRPSESGARPRGWPTVIAALAVVSIPFFALWSLSDSSSQVRLFRLVLTNITGIILTTALLLKFTRLNRELFSAFRRSEASLRHLREVQGQLLNAQKLASVSRLIAGTMHEINNPLAAIYGYSDLLAEGSSLDLESRTYVEKIQHHARRTKSIIQDLLAFSRPASSNKARLNSGVLLQNVFAQRSAKVKETKIATTLNIPSEMPDILGDETHLNEAFLRVLDNAISAVQQAEHPELSISASCDEDQLLIAFVDNGPGVIAPDLVFDPFYTTKAPGAGIGLGLSVAYGVIREHGGRIRCANTSQGGASFEISLPIAAPGVASIPVNT